MTNPGGPLLLALVAFVARDGQDVLARVPADLPRAEIGRWPHEGADRAIDGGYASAVSAYRSVVSQGESDHPWGVSRARS